MAVSKYTITCLLVWLACTPCQAVEAYFDYHGELQQAYRQILQLQTDDAHVRLSELKAREPYNLAILHIENYIDFFKAFIREEGADLDLFEEHLSDRFDLMDRYQIKDPYWRFSKAEMLFQYALARAKFGEEIRAGWDINRAYKLLKENDKMYPDFLLNKKSLSVIHTLIGSLKGIKRSLVILLTALEGSHDQGIEEITQLYASRDDAPQAFFGAESMVVRALIALHIEKDEGYSMQVIDQYSWDAFNSPLLDFVKASLLLQTDRHNKAEALLSTSVARSNQLPFYYLHLMLGICRLNRLDPSSGDHIMTFINNFKGRHYIKEAYQKMAWYALLVQKNEKDYLNYMSLCLSNGRANIGEDQDAQREAISGEVPHSLLLKARVLCDGGLYNRALEIISQVDINQLNDSWLTEYYYRLGRIYQGLDDFPMALRSFENTLSTRSQNKSYHSCSAALQLGIIYAGQGKTSKAKFYFEECLSIKPDEHRHSLHQKAQSWLLKLGE